MLKKLSLYGFNYKDLERISSTDSKRKEDAYAFYQTFDFLSLLETWPRLVGDKLAKVTSPLKIKFSSLIVATIHPSYSHELSYHVEPIKEAIFKEFPHLRNVITNIQFQTMPQFFQQKSIIEKSQELKKEQNTLHPQSPQYRLLSAKANKLFGHIEDPELKKMMINIYIQSAKEN